MNRQLLARLALAVGVDPTIESEGDLLGELCSASVGSDLVERLITTASEFVDDPQYARIKVSEYDVIYGMLDELRDEIGNDENAEYLAWQAEHPDQDSDNFNDMVIDRFLAKFATPADLWRWGASCIDANQSSKVDDDHDWWSSEFSDAEDYAEIKVKEILQP